MSMGVPGIMEPLRYQGHVYCDGGMTNDFPMNALPEGPGRLGLMVRFIVLGLGSGLGLWSGLGVELGLGLGLGLGLPGLC